MRARVRPFLFLAMLLLSTATRAADVTIRSGPSRTHLLELFTSEGCSSCPPAERWFSSLRTSPRLWKDVVPLAFHVDYWDGLGWKDPFASAASTDRQHRYAAAWNSDSVYTPGFVLDGREWRERELARIPAPVGNVGVLMATLRESGELMVTFQPAKAAAPWQAHAALLGFDLSSEVKAGENSGRKLQHDFVVLAQQSAAMTAEDGGTRASWKMPAAKTIRGASALAVWITEAGKTEPVQAAGGTLSK